MKKLLIFSLFFVFLLSYTTPLALLSFIASRTHKPLFYFPALLLHSLRSPPPPSFNLLFLGLDSRDDLLEKTTTTDTIILVNFSSTQGISAIPLPRDLWDNQISAKINQLYPLSQLQVSAYPYLQQNFQRVTGQRIDRTLILTTRNLIDIITLLGGLDLELPYTIKDDFYPNPEYIKNPNPSIPIYKTVYLPAGPTHLDSSNITEFVRSRKGSDNPQEGTDLGRIKRQQLVIDTLLSRLKSLSPRQDIETILSLYNYYGQNLETNLTDTDFMQLGLMLRHQLTKLSLNKITIPTGDNPQTDVIFHPASFTNQQWVYVTHQSDFSDLHQYIKAVLNGR